MGDDVVFTTSVAEAVWSCDVVGATGDVFVTTLALDEPEGQRASYPDGIHVV